MKENIHPQYRTVIFHDTSVDAYFKVGDQPFKLIKLLSMRGNAILMSL